MVKSGYRQNWSESAWLQLMNSGISNTVGLGLCILYIANCSCNHIIYTHRNFGTVAKSLEAKA